MRGLGASDPKDKQMGSRRAKEACLMPMVELSQGHRGTRCVFARPCVKTDVISATLEATRIRPMRLDNAHEGRAKPNLDTATSGPVRERERESDNARGALGTLTRWRSPSSGVHAAGTGG